MPNAEEGVAAVEEVFVNNVFASSRDGWRLASAIAGAHTLGSASIHNSGYNGAWSEPQDQGVFNNGYYKSLLLKGWGPELGVDGNPGKNQWKRIDSQTPENFPTLMLNTDMGLVFDQNKDHGECIQQANSAPRKDRMKERKKCKQFAGGKVANKYPGVLA